MIIEVLASYRILRLLQKDTFPPAERLRRAVRTHGDPWLQDLWECHWCLSFWVSLVVVSVGRRKDAQTLKRAFAVAAVTAVLAEAEEVYEGATGGHH